MLKTALERGELTAQISKRGGGHDMDVCPKGSPEGEWYKKVWSASGT